MLSNQKNVLLVDDDREDQEIFSYVLSEVSETVNCSFVDTAEDALETLQNNTSNKPDYIFLDLNLPYMSGFDCLLAIKENSLLNSIPVIIFSTSTRDIDKQKAKELGATGYISKPSTLVELKTLLHDVFVH